MVTILDTAAYILNHYQATIDTIRLQYLTYLAQGWYTVIHPNNQPMFDDDYIAASHGPENPLLTQTYPTPIASSTRRLGVALNHRQRLATDYVLNHYQAWSTIELAEMLRAREAPWDVTHQNTPPGSVISKKLIAWYFNHVLAT